MRLDAFRPLPLRHMVFQVRFTAEEVAGLPSEMRERMEAMVKFYHGARVGNADDHAVKALALVAEAVQEVTDGA